MRNKIFFLGVIGIILALTACTKDEPAPVAGVEVNDVTIDASFRKADIYWRVDANATTEVVVLEYSSDSAFSDYKQVPMNKVHAEKEDNLYQVSLDSLQEGTKYYARSRAINKINSCASKSLQFETKAYQHAKVSTDSIAAITVSSGVLHATLLTSGTDSIPQVGFCVATHKDVTIVDSCLVFFLKENKDSVAYAVLLDNLTDNTTYYVRAYAKNLKGVTYGEELSFTTYEIGMPQIGNTTISDITYTTAKAASQVLSDGGGEVTERGICYSTSSNPTTSANKIASGSGTGSFTCDLTNLSAGTTYYVRAYAINNKGTSYGNEISFTALAYGLPTVTTSEVTNISYTSATCGGNVTADGGQSVTERGVCYSTSSNPTTSANKIASGSGTGSFTCNLTGLTAGKKYYVRAYAINNKGTSYGNEISFTALAYGLPTVTTSEVTNISYTSATCGGNVTADGGQSVTERGVCYSTSSNPTTSANKIASGSGTGSFTCDLTNLTAGTTYYVRAYAINNKGTSYGNEVSFTALAYGLPTVTTSEVTNISYTSATCGGNVIADGGQSVTERGICYSTSSNPTTSANKIVSGSGLGSFTCYITGLTECATYYIRAYAVNNIGTIYGEEKTLMTLASNPYAVIYYTADAKLPETTNSSYPGLHTNAFGDVTIISHEFSNGQGAIRFTDSIEQIGDNAFNFANGTSSMTSITIPLSTKSIGNHAFYGCQSLMSIFIPPSVTSISETAFISCSGLTSIVVDTGNMIYDSRNNSNAIIETSTNTLIRGCVNTAIPNSVMRIGNNAFHSCTGLTSIIIPNSVTYIGNSAFFDCIGLTSVTIGKGVVEIGERAFGGCRNISSIRIPDSTTNIKQYAFSGCSAATSLIIGSAVQKIGQYAFSSSKFSSIQSNAITPPSAIGAFYISISTTLYVPSSSVSVYQHTYPWNEFTNILPINE